MNTELIVRVISAAMLLSAFYVIWIMMIDTRPKDNRTSRALGFLWFFLALYVTLSVVMSSQELFK